MNWYAMMLDGRMRQRELIEEAELRRRIARARRHRAPAALTGSRPVPAPTEVGPLQLLWRRLSGIQAR